MKIEVTGKFTQKVNVDPKEVIQELIRKEIGYQGWVVKKEDKFFKGSPGVFGHNPPDEFEEISEKEFKYIRALKHILNHLKHTHA